MATALVIMRKLSEGLSTFVCEQQQDEKMGMNSFDFTSLMGPTAGGRMNLCYVTWSQKER